MSKKKVFVKKGFYIPAWLADSMSDLDDASLCWFMRAMLEYIGVSDESDDFEKNAPKDAWILFRTWYNWIAEEAEEEYFNGQV